MKKFITIFIVFVVWCSIWSAPLLFSGDYYYLPEKDDGYIITDYDVEIVVGEDKVFHISEKITANFLETSHGITRYLPVFQEVSYLDENGNLISKNYKNQITNFKYDRVNSSASTSLIEREKSGGYIFYRMGQNNYITGTKTYAFEYDFYVGDDRIADKDLFYFNIIGTGWDTSISNVDFSIIFEDEISSEDFQFYLGEYGSTSPDSRLSYSISENKITGNAKNLNYGEAITVYNEFEEGYFKIDRSYVWDIVILVLALAIIGGIILYFVKKRRKTPIVEVVEFSAPDGLTPTEVGYINDGKLTGDEISALVVYWASKGYLKLKQEKDDVVRITKIKDLPINAKQHEKLFFEGLFKNRNEVLSDNLTFKDASVGYKIKTSIKEESKHLFDSSADKYFNIIIFSVLAVFGCLVLKNYFQAHYVGLKLLAGIAFVVLIGVGLWLYRSTIKNKPKLSSKKYFWLWLLSLILIFGAAIGLMFFIEPYSDAFGARFYLISLLILCVIVYPKIETYTEEGKKVLGKIWGLKRYIEVAEKDRIEMLAKENPEIFFEILPYAYVLGVSEKYMKKFEDVEILQPSWYECDTFTTLYFMHRMNRSMAFMAIAIRNNMINHNVSKVVSTVSKFSGGGGGGSSHGGGFSGGGSGGGGGGRW